MIRGCGYNLGKLELHGHEKTIVLEIAEILKNNELEIFEDTNVFEAILTDKFPKYQKELENRKGAKFFDFLCC